MYNKLETIQPLVLVLLSSSCFLNKYSYFRTRYVTVSCQTPQLSDSTCLKHVIPLVWSGRGLNTYKNLHCKNGWDEEMSSCVIFHRFKPNKIVLVITKCFLTCRNNPFALPLLPNVKKSNFSLWFYNSTLTLSVLLTV